MLEQILIYLNARLKTLFPDFTVLGLCEKVEEIEKDETIAFPAEYCANNEYKPIDIDNHKGLFYWRKNGTVNITFLEDEFSDDEMEQRTYPMRGVLFAPKDYYKTDNNYIEEKFADNIKKKMVFDGDKNFRIALKATDAEFNISRYETNRNNVIAEEFEGVKPKVPFDWVAMAFDYDIIITGNADCWDYWGCLDEPVEIPLCTPDPVTVVNTAGTTLGTPASGTTFTAPDATVLDSEGEPAVLIPSGTEYEMLAISGISDNSDSATNENYIIDDTLARIYASPVTNGASSLVNGDAPYIYSTYFSDISTGYIIPLLNFTTLKGNNKFGNTNRFTAIDGSQTLVDNYMIDHHLNLGIYTTLPTADTWANQKDAALAFSHTVDGEVYSDWFMITLEQALRLMNYSVSPVFNYAPLSLGNILIWVSDSVPFVSANSYRLTASTGNIESRAKTESRQTIFCRRHF